MPIWWYALWYAWAALWQLCISPAGAGAQTLPRPAHVVVVILENHHYTQVADTGIAPYLAELMNDSMAAVLTRSYGIGHPSQPNYIRLYAGSSQGVADNAIPAGIPFTSPNLGASLIQAGYSFATFSEDLPEVGFNGETYGAYARKHNPVTNWMGTDTNQVPPETNQPFTAFPDSAHFDQLPTVCFVVPNQDNDMHNGADPERITRGDTWVRDHIAPYVAWCRMHNSLLLLTFDEDDGSLDNRILTVLLGPMVRHGRYNDSVSHYGVLRMLEEMYGLPYAGRTSTAAQVAYCWKDVSSVPPASDAMFGVYARPQPAADELIVDISAPQTGGTGNGTPSPDRLEMLAGDGRLVRTIAPAGSQVRIPLRGLPAGLYLLRAYRGATIATRPVVILR